MQAEDENEEVQIKNLDKIFTKGGLNLSEFKKACEEEEYKVLIDFIETILRFFSLREKPGRTNPVSTLDEKKTYVFFEQLKKLKQKLSNTTYELKIQQIIQICKSKSSVKAPESTTPEISELTQQRMQQLLEKPEILDRQFKDHSALFNYAILQVLPSMSKKIYAINDHEARYEVVFKSLKFLNKIFHPTEIEVQISKNTLIETRVFRTVYENQFLKRQKWAAVKIAPVINESLLCPSSIQIQELLLKILKRLYSLWGDIIVGPLYLNMRNISLYSDDSPLSMRALKEAAIFSYKIMKEKSDIKFCDMVESSEDLKFLKENEYFSSKACAFPNEFGQIYDTLNFELPFWQYWHWVENRSLWVYNVIIEKANTMLSWKFWLKNYDIRFGIFKMDKCEHLPNIEEYESQKQCKQIIKTEKYSQTSSKNPVKGHIFLKPGYYNIVFDNTYSMMRGKDIYYQIQQLVTFI